MKRSYLLMRRLSMMRTGNLKMMMRRMMLMRAKRGPSLRALMLKRSPFHHQHLPLTHLPPLRLAGLLFLRHICSLTPLSFNPSPPSNWRSCVFEKVTLVYVMTSIVFLDKWSLLSRALHIFKGLLTAKKSESDARFSMKRSEP